jgi:hypothetical protein
MYVYFPIADGTFNVGFYAPSGRFVVESNHAAQSDAVSWMRYLNGAPIDDMPAPPSSPTPAATVAHAAEKKK